MSPSPNHRSKVLVLSVGALLAACGLSRLPDPAWTRQPTEALVEVPYPAAAPRVEFVPPQPADGAVWIDGEWTWRGRRWGWKRGRWVLAPQGARFSPPTTVRDAHGTLFAAEGMWRDARGLVVAEPAPLDTARSKLGEGRAPAQALWDGGREPSRDASLFLEGDAAAFLEADHDDP